MSTGSSETLKKAGDKELAEEAERLDKLDVPPPLPPRQGFLPIDTNLFDRWFISIVCLIAIHLLWLRFIEAILPIGFATGISLVLGYVIIRWG